MEYSVQQDDTLWGLSRKWGIPLQQLLAQVPESVRHDPRKLMPGMILDDGRKEAAPLTRKPTWAAQEAGRAWMQQQGGAEPVGPLEAVLELAAGGGMATRGGRALYKGYRSILDDAARADANMLRYSNADGAALARTGDEFTHNPVIRNMMNSRTDRTTPNIQRIYEDKMRQTNATNGWPGSPRPPNEATLIRQNPMRTGTSIRPHPDRGMVPAPARDINRAVEANPQMTLGELAGWLRNNPKGMTQFDRDVEASDLASWLKHKQHPGGSWPLSGQ